MFKANGRDAVPISSPVQPAKRPGIFSVIGADVVVAGNIVAKADLQIDGRVEGDVGCGALIQGADSQIVGCITAETARIAGAVEGGVHARQLTIERTARIIGDLEYESLTVETGARIDGRLRPVPESAPTSGPVVTVPPLQPIFEVEEQDWQDWRAGDTAGA